MDPTPFPSRDAYPLWTPINLYQRGFDLISEQWRKTENLRNEPPGSAEFETYIVWRMNLVIWTCSTIESCVNLEGVSWTGEEFYRNTVERQSIVRKIRLIYALKYGKCLPPDEDILKRVRALFDVRNHYVHPKTHRAKERDQNEDQNFSRLLAYKPEDLWGLVQRLNGLFPDSEHEDQSD